MTNLKRMWFPALTLIAAAVFTACPNPENTDPKTIVITGLSDVSGAATLALIPSISQESMTGTSYTITAVSYIPSATGDSLTFALKTTPANTTATGMASIGSSYAELEDWTGTGNYHLEMIIGSKIYFYTAGQNVSGWDALPKYDIQSTSSTINLDQFKALN